MTPERWQKQKAIFSRVQSASPTERAELLDLLCVDDAEMRREVEGLLAGMQAEDPFLDEGVVGRKWKAGDVLGNRFKLLRLAGEGGMGQVWVARDEGFQDEEVVAIKVIREDIASDAAAIDRFKRELQLARKVAHPNVCKLYELFVDEGMGSTRIFLTMEYLEGETLTSRLKREGKIQPGEALDWMRQLCTGLDAAHAAEVVHRDLKPANIMLAKSRSGAERAVITDFGLAKASVAASQGAALSVTGAIVGTPEYMAPEQIRGDRATAATDIYALGLIYYEMLKGERPFAGKNTLDAWMRRIREGPPALAGVVEDLPRQTDAVIRKCLEYDPAERYGSAIELWEGLQGRREWPRWRREWTIGVATGALAAVGFGAWLLAERMGGPSREAQLWYQDARRDMAEGAAVRAVSQLRRALAATPRYPAAYAALAEAQLELDQNALARESVLQASTQAGSGFGLSTADRRHIEGVSRLLLRDCPAAIRAFREYAEATEAFARPYAMTSLARAYERCDQGDEARRTLAAAAALDPRNAAVLVRSALLARREGRPAMAGVLQTAEAIYRERSNFEGVTEVLLAKGTFASEEDRLEEATGQLEEAMGLARTTKSAAQQVRILFQQSNVARRRGALGEARELAERSVRLAKDNDLETLSLRGIFAAANIHTIKNQNRDSAELLERAQEIATRYRDEENLARANLALAVNYQRLLRPDRAEAAITAALPYYERIGHSRNLATANYLLGQIEYSAVKNRAAVRRFRKVIEEARRIGDADLVLLASGRLAEALLETGEFAEAESLFAGVVTETRKKERARAAAYAVMAQAEAWSVMGRFGEAAAGLAEAKRLIEELEADAAVAPARHHRIATAADALRQGRFGPALEAIRGMDTPADAPASRLETLAIRCEAERRSGRHAEARRTCETFLAAADASGSMRNRFRSRVLRAELQAESGDKGGALQTVMEAVKEVSVEDARFAMFAVETVRFQAGEGASQKRASQILSDLRLQLGEPGYQRWVKRADQARRVRMLERF
ncbi:MAG: protein kinase [Bryobacterales bacterium]|nr:protein kinase [Bryobacterales bacterium]